MENFRRAIGLRIKENKEVYEGEVRFLNAIINVRMHIARLGDWNHTGRNRKSSWGIWEDNIACDYWLEDNKRYESLYDAITALLQRVTATGSKQLRLDPSIYEALQKEKVATGDVIYVEANNGSVKRVGRSDAYVTLNRIDVLFQFSIDCVTATQPNSIWMQRNTSQFPKAMFTRKRSLFRMWHYTTSILPMLVPREVKTFFPWWDKWWSQRKQKSPRNCEWKSIKSSIDTLTKELPSWCQEFYSSMRSHDENDIQPLSFAKALAFVGSHVGYWMLHVPESSLGIDISAYCDLRDKSWSLYHSRNRHHVSARNSIGSFGSNADH